MALVLADRVKETSTTTGTGTFTLAGAVAGFQSFAAIGNANTTFYCIAQQTAGQWEVGIGTYTSAGTTLSRDTVLASSTGAKVNFSAGTKDVFCTYPGSKALTYDANGNVTMVATGGGGGLPYSYSAPTVGGTLARWSTTGAGSNTNIEVYIGASGTSYIGDVGTQCAFGFNTTNQYGNFFTSNVERTRWDSTGNVIISHPSATNTYTSPAGTQTLVIRGLAQTANSPVIDATQTWNAGAVTFTGWQLNIVDTASAAASKLLDLQVGGVSEFNVQKNGTVNLGGPVNFTTSATLTAGTNAQGQGQITNDYTVVTTTAANPSGVTLPTATAGRRVVVVNKGTNPISLYPATGASIDASAANAAISVNVGAYIELNASSTTQWYSTQNVELNPAALAFATGFTSTATAGATTTLTNSSSYYQVFTGSSNQTIQLPATSTLTPGWSFHLVNNTTTGTLTLQTSTAVSLGTIPPGVTVMATALTNTGNTATDWEIGYTDFTAITGTGSAVLATQPTITSATLAAGTATAGTAPLKFTSGTNLTSPETGAVEYDGTVFYKTNDTTSGRGYTPAIQLFRLTANGANIGPTIANFFGANSAINLAAGGEYEIEAHCYFTKNTAGTVVVTATTSLAPVNLSGVIVTGAVGGGTAIGAANQIALFNSTATAAAFGATASLTNNTSHYMKITLIVEANASASNLRINFTSSAGTVTPLRTSYYKVTKLPAGNSGSFAA